MAEPMPRVVDGALPRVRAGEDFNTLVAAVLVHFLDAPILGVLPVLKDLGAQIVGVRADRLEELWRKIVLAQAPVCR
jgi:hypothetical protein